MPHHLVRVTRVAIIVSCCRDKLGMKEALGCERNSSVGALCIAAAHRTYRLRVVYDTGVPKTIHAGQYVFVDQPCWRYCHLFWRYGRGGGNVVWVFRVGPQWCI